MRKTAWLILTLIAASPATAPARGGMIVLSGDTNIINSATGDRFPVDSGDARFFRNLLAGGSRVLIRNDVATSPFNYGADLVNLYDSIGGVTSTVSADPLTAAGLAGVSLYIAIRPATAYTVSEYAALGDFLAGGGTAFFLGDIPSTAASNAVINANLLALGSSLRLTTTATRGGGLEQVGAANIAAGPLMAGVSTFSYASALGLSGGTTLVTSTDGLSVLAFEVTPGAVPEPSSLAMVALAGLAGLVGQRSRRRRAPAGPRR